MSKPCERKSRSATKGFKPEQKHKIVSRPKDIAQKTIISQQINQQFHLGIQYYKSGNLVEAEACFQQVLEWQPNNPDAWHLIGVIAARQKQYPTATERINRAIQLKPTEANFYNNLGRAYLEQGQFQKAIDCYQEILQLQPKNAETYSILGNLYRGCGHLGEAIATYKQLLNLNPQDAVIYTNIGVLYIEQGQPQKAIECFRQAINLKPDYAQAYNNLGNLCRELGQLKEAQQYLQQAIELNPSYADAHCNLAIVYQKQGKVEAAINSYKSTLELKPNYPTALVQYIWEKRCICSWDDSLLEAEKSLITASHSQQWDTFPFTILAVSDNPTVQLAAAQNSCTNCIDHSSSPLWKGQRYTHDKIRLAYLSADYHEHATAYLMAELFECHDRSRFELFAISFGPENNSPMRQRLVQAFDHFIDVRQMSHFEAAQQIRNLEIDIAVDLKGYTKDSRSQILAYRPAPIQVNYLGYPSTMGADFIDYILVDPFIVPPNQQSYFTKKLVYLTDCYQVNDGKRIIADCTPSRQECGLPARGFVFCSFNNSYKITPAIFEIWMRLLKAVPDSILWLLSRNQLTEENLRREAQARGVNPERLVFAPPQKLPEHLARHRLADLFLDNLPCNAHTTTSDALWSELPVLTCAGRSFASRVAGSLLHGIGLPELVTYSLEDYEALALKLATQPDFLRQIKEKLKQNRLSTPLFDGDRFRQHIEAAYMEMWSIWQRGEKPRAFAIEPWAMREESSMSPKEARLLYKCCPLCESSNISFMGKADCHAHPLYNPRLPGTIFWKKCNACGHSFTDGYFTEEALNILFSKANKNQLLAVNKMEQARALSAMIIDKISSILRKQEGKWLDIGFGNGALLITCAEYGFEPVGIDLRKEAVERIKSLGIEAYCQEFIDFEQSGTFTVISMADVLEHMPYPKKALARAYKLLAPGGLLFVSCPNADSLVWKSLTESQKNPYWGEIEHYHNFGRKRLYNLLIEHGFKPVNYSVSKRYRIGMEVISIKE